MHYRFDDYLLMHFVEGVLSARLSARTALQRTYDLLDQAITDGWGPGPTPAFAQRDEPPWWPDASPQLQDLVLRVVGAHPAFAAASPIRQPVERVLTAGLEIGQALPTPDCIDRLLDPYSDPTATDLRQAWQACSQGGPTAGATDAR